MPNNIDDIYTVELVMAHNTRTNEFWMLDMTTLQGVSVSADTSIKEAFDAFVKGLRS